MLLATMADDSKYGLLGQQPRASRQSVDADADSFPVTPKNIVTQGARLASQGPTPPRNFMPISSPDPGSYQAWAGQHGYYPAYGIGSHPMIQAPQQPPMGYYFAGPHMPVPNQTFMGYPSHTASMGLPQQSLATFTADSSGARPSTPLAMTPRRVSKSPSPAVRPPAPKATFGPAHRPPPSDMVAHIAVPQETFPSVPLPHPEVSPLSSPELVENRAFSREIVEQLQANVVRSQISVGGDSQTDEGGVTTANDVQQRNDAVSQPRCARNTEGEYQQDEHLQILDLIPQPQAAKVKATKPQGCFDEQVFLPGGTPYASPNEDFSDDDYSNNEDCDETENRKASLSEDGVNFLEDCAFNLDREAYEHFVPRHLTAGKVIHVRKLNLQNLAQHRDEAHHSDTRPALLPPRAERKKPKHTKSIECVWVGMLPSHHQADEPNTTQPSNNDNAGEGSSTKLAKSKPKPKASIADLNEKSMKVSPYDPKALRVVARKANKPAKQWFLYALLNPDDSTKLCEGFKVDFEKVYYFRLFRDDNEKRFLARRQAMKEKIMTKTFPALATNGPSPSPSPATGRTPLPASPILSGVLAEKSTSKPIAKKRPQTDDTQDEGVVDGDQAPSQKRPRVSPLAHAEKKHVVANPSSAISLSSKASSSQADVQTPPSTKAKNVSGLKKTGHVVHDKIIKAIPDAQGRAKAKKHMATSCDQVARESNKGGHHSTPESTAQGPVAVPEGEDAVQVSLEFQSEGFAMLADTDDDASLEHKRAVDAVDTRFISYRDDMLSSVRCEKGDKIRFTLQEKGKGKEKCVSSQEGDSQVIDNGSDVVRSVPGQSHEANNGGYVGDDEEENEQEDADRQKGLEIITRIQAAAQELLDQDEIGALRQIATMVDSIKDRKAPPNTSPLKLYLNVPSGETTDTKSHTEQYNQLLVRSLRPVPSQTMLTLLRRFSPPSKMRPNSTRTSSLGTSAAYR